MATRTVSRIYDEELAPSGLRTTEYSILARLRFDGPATVGTLAAMMPMDRTTLTREVAPLAARGLVVRAVGDDRRRRVLSLTEEGRKALRRARPGWERAQARLDAQFGGDRASRLRAELHALVRSSAAT